MKAVFLCCMTLRKIISLSILEKANLGLTLGNWRDMRIATAPPLFKVQEALKQLQIAYNEENL